LETRALDVADALAQLARTQAALGRQLVVRVSGTPAVQADAEALERVLINLVDNAFTHGGGMVELEAVPDERDGRMVRLSVLDRGPGVPAGDAARVFDRFSRGAKVTSPGMGLGLYLVKTLVERQGGHIAVTERPGGGAAFNVALPAAEARVEVQR
jgi:signal transduction histidine kinase